MKRTSIIRKEYLKSRKRGERVFVFWWKLNLACTTRGSLSLDSSTSNGPYIRRQPDPQILHHSETRGKPHSSSLTLKVRSSVLQSIYCVFRLDLVRLFATCINFTANFDCCAAMNGTTPRLCFEIDLEIIGWEFDSVWALFSSRDLFSRL